ncbi:hypothetical protein CDIK_2992 [Cucumispora dikerogammari]|nr:hypothetical protein CDIK_2992 [Cucumispora dikerogammari]
MEYMLIYNENTEAVKLLRNISASFKDASYTLGGEDLNKLFSLVQDFSKTKNIFKPCNKIEIQEEFKAFFHSNSNYTFSSEKIKSFLNEAKETKGLINKVVSFVSDSIYLETSINLQLYYYIFSLYLVKTLDTEHYSDQVK